MQSQTVGSFISLTGALLTAAALAACGDADFGRNLFRGKDQRSLVRALDVRPSEINALRSDTNAARLATADQRSLAAQASPASTAVTGAATFHKSRLFDREFLYGFDLQYSSGADPTLSLIDQSMAMGHVPCFFRRLGDQLQLVADQSRLYESVVNHPELLLATYHITAEDTDTLTVSFDGNGLVLNQVANGPASDAPQESWVRSLTYVEDGDYLLQESALLLKSGEVQTFMESVFPRANIVPSDYQPLSADTQYEPLAARYRFLGGEKVYVEKTVNGQKVRVPTTFATHFLLGEKGTIDWYVTPNISDEFLPIMKSGVEGWNRYYKTDLGRDVMRFLGRLPDGVKIGDPRYNVINFDSVAQAGAAYETQAQDPLTGIQSHSLIYMPLAWYNIGAALWKERADSTEMTAAQMATQLEPKGAATVFGVDRKILSCVRSTVDASLTAELMVEAIKAEDQTSTGGVPVPRSIDEFSKRLMISTLFHEVGHSLGFAHEFKGSLAFDSSQPVSDKNATTWSVMDYNYYQNEQTLFKDIGGADGPALEYDRQVISQIYHSGKEVKADDKVIPACEDSEADATDNGVDPLCVRYDSDSDPSLGVAAALNNFAGTTGAGNTESKTLAEAVATLKDPLSTKLGSASTVPNADALQKTAKALGSQVGELVNYYLASGAQSLRGNLNVNSKSLRLWVDGVPVQEVAFRQRYLTALNAAMAYRDLPDAPKSAIADLSKALQAAAAANTAVGATDSERAANAALAATAFNAAINAKVHLALVKLRTTAYGFLGYDLKNPFTLTMGPGADLSHLEELAPKLLAAGVQMGLDGDSATLVAANAERLAAAKALLTFKGASPVFDDTVAKLNAVVTQGLAAGNTRLVAASRNLLGALGQ